MQAPARRSAALTEDSVRKECQQAAPALAGLRCPRHRNAHNLLRGAAAAPAAGQTRSEEGPSGPVVLIGADTMHSVILTVLTHAYKSMGGQQYRSGGEQQAAQGIRAGSSTEGI